MENEPETTAYIDELFNGAKVEMNSTDTANLVIALYITHLRFPNPIESHPKFIEYSHYSDDDSQLPEDMMKSLVDYFLDVEDHIKNLINRGFDLLLKEKNAPWNVFGLGIIIPNSASSHIKFISKSDEEPSKYIVTLRQAYVFGEYKKIQVQRVVEYLATKDLKDIFFKEI